MLLLDENMVQTKAVRPNRLHQRFLQQTYASHAPHLQAACAKAEQSMHSLTPPLPTLSD